MSPHAVLPQNEALLQQQELAETFSVSRHGFLPEEPPLKTLENSYYLPWEIIIVQLSSLIDHRLLRDHVQRLPILSTSYLRSEPEWRRAYVLLAFLTHGYIWGDDEPAEVLPPSLAVPLLEVSQHLGLPPVATYAALNLWNYESTDPTSSPSNLDALSALHTFTGTESESWFYMVSVAMEDQAGSLIPKMTSALSSIPTRDYATITSSFNALTDCISNVTALLSRMHEKCDPEVFYHRIRPFLAGSRNMGPAGLPCGVFYDEGDGRGSWRQLRGGSNGQSSLIQFFDVVLGVEHSAGGHSSPHSPGGKTDKAVSFHEEVRDYMPGPHRHFLEHVAKLGSLRNFALGDAYRDHDEHQRACRAAFQSAVDALAELRSAHLKVVSRYIVVPSRAASQATVVKNLASASSHSKEASEGQGDDKLTGTGGTALLPFLKQSRQETIAAGTSPSMAC
ncbi:Indoleamine 2,3-dioxygenase [Xylariaceae sp. FL0016]|nr:Indoleamine 2,3-dioxygenase [Xylariaceae sp. FL0016]